MLRPLSCVPVAIVLCVFGHNFNKGPHQSDCSRWKCLSESYHRSAFAIDTRAHYFMILRYVLIFCDRKPPLMYQTRKVALGRLED